MKRLDSKSHCPINFALEAIGDPWSLLIVRDIVYFGKRTYGEFLHSEERIATNILACRLLLLEEKGVITKTPDPGDKRKEIYQLTEKGRDLIPLMVEMSLWGARYDTQTAAPQDFINHVRSNKQTMIETICDCVSEDNSVFVGPKSVVSQLHNSKEYRMFKNTQAFSGFSTNDLEPTEAFYKDVLGLNVTKEPMGLTLHLATGALKALSSKKYKT